MELARREKLEQKLAHQKSITKKALKWYKEELLYGRTRARVRNPSNPGEIVEGAAAVPMVQRYKRSCRASVRARARDPGTGVECYCTACDTARVTEMWEG